MSAWGYHQLWGVGFCFGQLLWFHPCFHPSIFFNTYPVERSREVKDVKTISPFPTCWAFLLIYSFLMLSIMVPPNESLSTFNSTCVHLCAPVLRSYISPYVLPSSWNIITAAISILFAKSTTIHIQPLPFHISFLTPYLPRTSFSVPGTYMSSESLVSLSSMGTTKSNLLQNSSFSSNYPTFGA